MEKAVVNGQIKGWLNAFAKADNQAFATKNRLAQSDDFWLNKPLENRFFTFET